jgi:lactoylglutathione lyase
MLRIPSSEQHIELIEYANVTKRAVDPAPPHPGTTHISLLVRGLLRLHRRLVRSGARFQSEPVTVPVGPNKGRLAVYMIDPDGFRVELVELEPTTPAT